MTSRGESGHQEAPASRLRLAQLLSATVVLLVVLTFAADYLSSWLPAVAGFPAGALMRDGLAIALVGCGIVVAPLFGATRPPRASSLTRFLVPFLLFAVWVAAFLAVSHPLVAGLLAARNLLLYWAVAFAVLRLWSHGLIVPRIVLVGLATLATLAALLGIADTLTQGRIVDVLGYRRDYASVAGSADRLISGVQGNFGGIVRASGGISNALVFGYLMSVLALLAISGATAVRSPRLRSRTTIVLVLAAALAVIASLASLTRGAWLGLGIGSLVLVVTRFRRETVLTVAAVGGIAVAVTLLGAPFVPTVAQGASGTNAPTASATPGALSGIVGAITDRAGSSDQASQTSSGLRIDELRAGVAQLVENPMGTGLGSEGAASDRAGASRRNVVPDIYVLIVALQTGIPGLVLWLLLLGVILATAARRATEAGNALVVAIVAVVAVSSVLSSAPDAPVFSLIAALSIVVLPAWWSAQVRFAERPAPG
jgi:O-Antigen ligase